MDVKVNITPEQISEHVSQAVLDSALGDALKKELENAVKEWTKTPYRYGESTPSPLRKLVDDVLGVAVRDMLREDGYMDLIRKGVKEAVTEDLVQSLAGSAMQYWLNVLKDKSGHY